MTLSLAEGTLIKGESTDEIDATKDDGPIEILSFQQHVVHESDAQDTSSTATIVASHRPVTVIKPLDNVTPKLIDIAGTPPGEEGLVVGLGLVQRTGSSKDATDKWDREVYFYLELSHAYISEMRLVADARMHPDDLPLLDGGDVGPLEMIKFTYRKAEWWYGKVQNKKTWKHPSLRAGG